MTGGYIKRFRSAEEFLPAFVDTKVGRATGETSPKPEFAIVLPMPKPPFAVIFDMDGVLIDSTASVHRSWTTVLARHGVDINKVRDPHGENHRAASMRDLLQAVHEQCGTQIKLDSFIKETVAILLADLKARGAAVEPGLTVLLDELAAHNVPLAIATSAAYPSAYGKLDILGIRDRFAVILTADDVSLHKPDPEIYLAAAEQLVVDPSRCIVIEDSVAGVAAGKSAGMKVIGFTKHTNKKDGLMAADLVADSWEELNFSQLQRLVTN